MSSKSSDATTTSSTVDPNPLVVYHCRKRILTLAPPGPILGQMQTRANLIPNPQEQHLCAALFQPGQRALLPHHAVARVSRGDVLGPGADSSKRPHICGCTP